MLCFPASYSATVQHDADIFDSCCDTDSCCASDRLILACWIVSAAVADSIPVSASASTSTPPSELSSRQKAS